MNLALMPFFPDRTQESIKGARRKAAYKQMVQECVRELQGRAGAPGVGVQQDVVDGVDSFLAKLQDAPRLEGAAFAAEELQAITDRAGASGKDRTAVELAAYLLEVFPPRTDERRPFVRRVPEVTTNRRKRRRREYAETQRLWGRSVKRCIEGILKGPDESRMPPKEVMEPFWRNILETVSDTVSPPDDGATQDLGCVWTPIRPEEVATSKPALGTAVGPDGVTARQVRAVPFEILARMFSLMLWTERIPERLRSSRTVLIPKKNDAQDPGDFRPITVSPIIVRWLHSILARRLREVVILDPRQRAFLAVDGCAENTVLMDLLLRFHNDTYKSCHLASLDVGKAFDTLAHPAIFSTLRSFGLPPPFQRYLSEYYRSGTTVLEGRGWVSGRITPRRGVKQGDPLSPLIFNMAMDRVLRALPATIGSPIGTRRTNALAFADDLVLCAETRLGLQRLLDTTYEELERYGLRLNPAKCMTLSIIGMAKKKTTAVDPAPFTIGGRQAPSLVRSSKWRYLGVEYSPDGASKVRPLEDLAPKLERLTRAPLKPQQRLHALRSTVIPQLYYRLALGRVQLGCLKKADRIVRQCVRQWLCLPHDVPMAFFHADVADGGLGIPSLRYVAPLYRIGRLQNIGIPIFEEAQADVFLAAEMDRAVRRLAPITPNPLTSEGLSRYWRRRLRESMDGGGLKEASRHPQAHRWVREPTRLLTGRDFIQCIKTRFNCLPTRSRTSRGRRTDRQCRAGCLVPETLNHVSQQCPRTHGARVARHDSVCKYLERNLKSQGYVVAAEPILETADGNKKPDLVARRDGKLLLIDSQVITDAMELDEAHHVKRRKYDTSTMRDSLRRKYGPTDISILTATLNWRGVWSAASVAGLLEAGVVKKNESALLSTRTLIGTSLIFRQFSASTSVVRTGVG